MRATENGNRWFVGARERNLSDRELTRGARQGVPEKSCQTRGAREGVPGKKEKMAGKGKQVNKVLSIT